MTADPPGGELTINRVLHDTYLTVSHIKAVAAGNSPVCRDDSRPARSDRGWSAYHRGRTGDTSVTVRPVTTADPSRSTPPIAPGPRSVRRVKSSSSPLGTGASATVAVHDASWAPACLRHRLPRRHGPGFSQRTGVAAAGPPLAAAVIEIGSHDLQPRDDPAGHSSTAPRCNADLGRGGAHGDPWQRARPSRTLPRAAAER